MKRSWIIIGLVIALAGLAFWLHNKSSRETINNPFLVSDTSKVTKLFLADKNNNTILISRNSSRGWRINDSLMPIKENIDLVLSTLSNIQIKYPVSKSASNTAIKRLATKHVKVEVYGEKALVEIFGVPLFEKERLLNVFYVGGPTTDNLGTIMKAEQEDQLYVTYLAGFKGYLTERFSPMVADWQSHLIFTYQVSDLESVRLDFPMNITESYEIINKHNRTFTLTRLYDNTSLPIFDTLRVMESLAAFNRINYEALLDGMEKDVIDSLLSSKPLRVLTLKTTNGKQHILKMYRRANKDGLLDYEGNEFEYDVDRVYGFLDNNTTPVSLQYFVIDNISRPLSYFLERLQENDSVQK
jgi:hypothetical protein